MAWTRNLIGSTLLPLAACRLWFDPIDASDGNAGGEDARALCSFGPWSDASLVAELSTNVEELSPAVSADGRAVVFGSNRVGGTGDLDLWYATRPAGSLTFDAPVELVGINSTADDASPSLSADGLTLYFDTGRNGPGEIFVSQRSTTADLFTTATLVSGVFAGSVGSPEISDDGLTLYYDRMDSPAPGGSDLMVVTRASPGAAWSSPVVVTGLNSAMDESDSVLDPDGLTFYFTSNRFEVAKDLFVARRPDTASPFSNPTQLPLGFGSGIGENGADVSADGTTMMLSAHDGAPALTNIWRATRTCTQ